MVRNWSVGWLVGIMCVVVLTGCSFSEEQPVPIFPEAVEVVDQGTEFLTLIEFVQRQSGEEISGDVKIYRLPQGTTPTNVLDFYSAELAQKRSWEETRNEINILGLRYGNGTWTKGTQSVEIHIVPPFDETNQLWMLKTEVR
ncbi:hypothetical protein HC928_00915 [bacterium]|nr:hypothetical protein [bacterium]